MSLLDPEGGSQKATLVVLLLLLVTSSLKILKAFLIRSRAQRNFVYVERLLVYCRRSACSAACVAAACCSTIRGAAPAAARCAVAGGA